MLQTRLPGKCPNWVGIQMGNHRTIIELNGEWGTAPCLIHDTEGEPSNHQFALLLSIYPMNFPWYSHETMEKMCLTNSDGFKWYTRGHPVVRMRYSATLRHLELFREDMGRFKGLPLGLGSKNHGFLCLFLILSRKSNHWLYNQPKQKLPDLPESRHPTSSKLSRTKKRSSTQLAPWQFHMSSQGFNICGFPEIPWMTITYM